ncbi:S1C family serine protease [Paenibacillus sp. GCM10027626]|uniref:S1C family serine protease n=1 Tax=Paenibacillus sp. GCM10027626 TaxID=3273411 RepID=UPI0036309B9E
MSLFDDEFYSTRVSRRARGAERESRDFSNQPMRKRPMWRQNNWTTVRIVAVSSLASAIFAVLLFGMITGFERGGGPAASVLPASVSSLTAGDDPLGTIQAADKVRPAVVSIINEQKAQQYKGKESKSKSKSEEDADTEDKLVQAAVGSGVIFEKIDGKVHIITNAHVVTDAVSLKAVLSNGEVRSAKLVGVDEITDLAVIEMDGKGIDKVAEIGDSKGLRAGQWVMAIGNPLGLSDSLTLGIVSKTHRIIPVSLSQDGVYDWEQEVIQVDASINQGNSGGPLIDLSGKVVGINSMKVADFGVEGVGFAIPTHFAMPIVESLLEYGKVKRPYLGVYTMDLRHYMAQMGAVIDEYGDMPDDGGDWLDEGSADSGPGDDSHGNANAESSLNLPKEVKDGVVVLEAVGPSTAAGLKYNDVIVKLDKQPITSTMDLRKYLYTKKKIGDSIEITYYREGDKMTTTLTLEEKSNDE